MSEIQVPSRLVPMEDHEGQAVPIPSLVLVVFWQPLVSLGSYTHHSSVRLHGHGASLCPHLPLFPNFTFL